MPSWAGQSQEISSEAAFWNCAAEQLSHQSYVDRSGRDPTTWLQARDASLEVAHRLQHVAPNPTQGSSHSLGLAGSPSDLSTPPRPPSCGEGSRLLFFRLRIQPHACQMVSRANVSIKSFRLVPAPWRPGSGSLLAGNCFVFLNICEGRQRRM